MTELLGSAIHETPATEEQAYTLGWHACMAGIDGRYVTNISDSEDIRYAWFCGFTDAMEEEDEDEPEPACAGFE